MPIVLSYTDVEALGALAYGAGSATGLAQGSAVRADRMQGAADMANRTALAQQRLAAQQADAAAGRAFQGQQAEADRQFQREQLAARESQLYAQSEADVEAARLRGEAQVQREQLEQQGQARRDERLHQQALEQIRFREAVKQQGGTPGTPGTPAGFGDGLPDKKAAQQQVQQFGNLIPFEAGSAVSADAAARNRDRAMETAEGLAGLPTEQIEQIIDSRPDDQWTPFLRALVQSRSGPPSPRGAMPEGRGVPGGAAGGGQSLTSGSGFSTGLEGLSDAQLQQLARDPSLLNRLAR